jgi:hypothetical protein
MPDIMAVGKALDEERWDQSDISGVRLTCLILYLKLAMRVEAQDLCNEYHVVGQFISNISMLPLVCLRQLFWQFVDSLHSFPFGHRVVNLDHPSTRPRLLSLCFFHLSLELPLAQTISAYSRFHSHHSLSPFSPLSLITYHLLHAL